MSIKTVDANTLKAWLDKGEAIVVDVREPAEHEAQNIPGATLLPLSTVSKAALPNSAGAKLVIHCRKGGRGSAACEKLLAEDPNLEIYNLEGGIEAWLQNHYEVKTSGKFFLALDRQVQLTIGSGVLLGSVLGYFVNPAWFLVSGFLGLGLINAGLTGWCGLALLMAKMPWNQGRTQPKNFCMAKR
jgi:rhodanese-related sulfurtransferase